MNHISVDCVVLGFDGDRLNVLLLKRNDFQLHDMKLPGSLIYADENLDQAASRIMADLLGAYFGDFSEYHPWCSGCRGGGFPMDFQLHSFVHLPAYVQHEPWLHGELRARVHLPSLRYHLPCGGSLRLETCPGNQGQVA